MTTGRQGSTWRWCWKSPINGKKNLGSFAKYQDPQRKNSESMMLADRQNDGNSPVFLCGCWCTGRAWRLTLKANAGARGTQDLRRCFRPPINDEAPPSSFHTKTDGLHEKEHVSHWQRRLQFLNYSYGVTCVGDYRSPKGMTSSLIKNSMVSSSQSSTLLSSSSVSTPGGHMTILARSPIKRGVARALSSPTSSECQPEALLFLVDLVRVLPVAAVILHHGPALVHQLLLPSKQKIISD